MGKFDYVVELRAVERGGVLGPHEFVVNMRVKSRERDVSLRVLNGVCAKS